eukprot:TRINITY_DN14806_c0_g1_i1.p1 TRINITY_DN14806_c0_g1~~TRINITY_DN14806_c0_g1_i1.p1  ORF type:complete len:499 (-),score=104.82 TRINITY_DN14806_c0_g1_i1:288-1784(-)
MARDLASDDEDEDKPEVQVERALPREVRQRAFADCKERLLLTDDIIAESPDVRALAAATQRVRRAVERGETVNRNDLRRELGECRRVADQLPSFVAANAAAAAANGAEGASFGDGASRAAYQPPSPAWRDGPLGAWRPRIDDVSGAPLLEPGSSTEGVGNSAKDQGNTEADQGDGATASVGANDGEGAAEPVDASALQWPEHLRVKKASADANVRNGAYAAALETYETLIEQADDAVAPELRAVAYSNAALCTVKLAPEQTAWRGVRLLLSRTVDLCDSAIQLDASNVKAHYRRGCALEALEDFRGAREAYERAELLAPADPAVRKATDRAACYEEDECPGGCPDKARVAAARARLLASDRGWRRRAPALSAAAERRRTATSRKSSGGEGSIYTRCCHCSADDPAGGYFAAPCGHGPFCSDCRQNVDAAGELRFCPRCRRCPTAGADCGIVAEWRRGSSDAPSAQGVSGASKAEPPSPPPPSRLPRMAVADVSLHDMD